MKKKKKNLRDEIPMMNIPSKLEFNINSGLEEWQRRVDIEQRRLYLYHTIISHGEDTLGSYETAYIIESIMYYNRIDKDKPISERIPVILYINSPGGDITEGFSLIAAIELSKTPIYTVNVGEWSSMSFWVGITGHKRYSLPYMTFLMHDGDAGFYSSASKAQDSMDYYKRFNQEVIREHVLKYSNMKKTDYDALSRVELYMLPEDALERGFIDEIVTDIDDIL